MITNITQFRGVCQKEFNKIYDLPERYITEEGHAAKEAYKDVLWIASFHDSLSSLYEDQDYQSLSTKSDKHPEYYKILNTINRAIIRALNK